ncbi:MAG: glycosyltransferase family 9 protein [Nitrospirae bacterium]|nr:glycosyltransferase family 9 protein [Nitrospirota bacterium]
MTSAPERLLIVKPSSFGDIIHTLPALDAVHRSWPRTAVDWIVKPEWMPLLQGHPMLREALPFPMSWRAWRRMIPLVRQRRYEMVLDLQGLLRSGVLSLCTGAPIRIGFANAREGSPWCYTRRVALPAGSANGRPPSLQESLQAPRHAIDRYLHLVREAGASSQAPVRFPLPSWPEAARWVDDWWDKAGLQPKDTVCVLHPAARWETKRWPAERFARLADRLVKEQGWRVILVAGPAERTQVEAVGRLMQQPYDDLSGRTTLPQLAALLARAALLITNDSGPMHLAVAVGIPVVALFGPTDPRKIGPYGPGHHVLQAGVDCSPCGRQRCTQGLACMNAISVEEAYAAALRVRRPDRVGVLSGCTGDVEQSK